MKIAVMGTGGVGGYFGARLTASGEEVSFIARGAHLAAIRERGLRVFSENGNLTIDPAFATDDPAEIGPVDYVFFCVKLWDTDAAAEAIRPMIGAGTAVISFQNGVHAEGRLVELLGAAHVMGGVAGIMAAIAAPGVIRHTGTFAFLEFGELDNSRSARAEALLEACTRAGIEARIADDIEVAIWRKFVFLTAFSAATCVAHLPVATIREDARSRGHLARLISEASAVARAKGVAIPDDLEARLMEQVDGLPAGSRSSMLNDLERGNRLELDWLSGTVRRLGEALGVGTPAHDAAYHAIELDALGEQPLEPSLANLDILD